MTVPTTAKEMDEKGGFRAQIFAFKVHLLQNGDLQTAVQDVDTDVIKKCFLDNCGPDSEPYANQVCAVLNHLNAVFKQVDHDIGVILSQ